MIFVQDPLQGIQGFSVPEAIYLYLIAVSIFFFHELVQTPEYTSFLSLLHPAASNSKASLCSTWSSISSCAFWNLLFAGIFRKKHWFETIYHFFAIQVSEAFLLYVIIDKISLKLSRSMSTFQARI